MSIASAPRSHCRPSGLELQVLSARGKLRGRRCQQQRLIACATSGALERRTTTSHFADLAPAPYTRASAADPTAAAGRKERGEKPIVVPRARWPRARTSPRRPRWRRCRGGPAMAPPCAVSSGVVTSSPVRQPHHHAVGLGGLERGSPSGFRHGEATICCSTIARADIELGHRVGL